MVNLIRDKFTTSITPFPQAVVSFIQEPDTSGPVVNQRGNQVLLSLLVKELGCPPEVEIISFAVLVSLEDRNQHLQGLEAGDPSLQGRFASCPVYLALRVDEVS